MSSLYQLILINLDCFYQARDASYLNYYQRHRPCLIQVLNHFAQPNDADGHQNFDSQYENVNVHDFVDVNLCCCVGRIFHFLIFLVLHDHDGPNVWNKKKCF